MKILVTGRNGQVGSALQQISIDSKDEFYFTDRKQLDITCNESIKNVFSKLQPQVLINCAAYTDVEKAESEKKLAHAVNSYGCKYLADRCKIHNCLFIHISTDYVYSGEGKIPFRETDKTAPKSIYGLTKLKGENFVKENCDSYVILRTSWVFDENGKNFVNTIKKLSLKSNELRIISDQTGSPTSAHGIAKALLKIIKHYENNNFSINSGIYNFSGKSYLTWYDFAKVICDLLFKDRLEPQPKLIPISTDEFQAKAPRPKFSAMDISKIHREFDIIGDDWTNVLKKYLSKEKKL